MKLNILILFLTCYFHSLFGLNKTNSISNFDKIVLEENRLFLNITENNGYENIIKLSKGLYIDKTESKGVSLKSELNKLVTIEELAGFKRRNIQFFTKDSKFGLQIASIENENGNQEDYEKFSIQNRLKDSLNYLLNFPNKIDTFYNFEIEKIEDRLVQHIFFTYKMPNNYYADFEAFQFYANNRVYIFQFVYVKYPFQKGFTYSKPGELKYEIVRESIKYHNSIKEKKKLNFLIQVISALFFTIIAVMIFIKREIALKQFSHIIYFIKGKSILLYSKKFEIIVESKVLHIAFFIWTFLNTCFLIVGISADYYYRIRDFWWFGDNLRLYDYSEYFIYVGIPLFIYFLMKRYGSKNS